MGDLSDKGSECDDVMNYKRSGSSSSDGCNLVIKTCADCGTTKTPLWRGGPAGPKSLCNACGIRSRKKRRALIATSKEDKKSKKSSMAVATGVNTATATTTSGGDSQTSGLTITKGINGGDFCLKKRLMALGSEVVLQRPRSRVTKRRRKVGEEEQAAILLMALSCGSVFG